MGAENAVQDLNLDLCRSQDVGEDGLAIQKPDSCPDLLVSPVRIWLQTLL